MKKTFLLFATISVIGIANVIAQSKKQRVNIPQITYAGHAPNIARIIGDTIIIAAGSTYLYTVDTPEDQGLANTKIDAKQLLQQIRSADGSRQNYIVTDKNGAAKQSGDLLSGDHLVVTEPNGKNSKTYHILLKQMALSGKLDIEQSAITAKATQDITLNFTAGQRSPDASISIKIPVGIAVNMDNTTVNVIGRGAVKLSGLSTQSIGRTGTKYSYSKVGEVSIKKTATGSVINFKHIDLRPANGADLQITIAGVHIDKPGEYQFSAQYGTSQPEKLTSSGRGTEICKLMVTNGISDFERTPYNNPSYRESAETYSQPTFKWEKGADASGVSMMQSTDEGKTWSAAKAVIDPQNAKATVKGLEPNKLYMFKLQVSAGSAKGNSNIVRFYSGKMDIKSFGIVGNGADDNTDAINNAISYINSIGGGTLLFPEGVYPVRTVHLLSNVYLYLAKGAVIKALKGGDAPETTWFSDRKYRSGLSPTDMGPYADPENYMTKEDVGHHYFKNAMFFGERLDNVKIIGSGQIDGAGNLAGGDGVMKNAPDSRCDKMFSLKLCTNVEIGGVYHPEDMWYDEETKEPYYMGDNGARIFDADNMLKIDRSGHFALLAAGTDGINIHDTYISKNNQTNVRDVYDFMECNNVTVSNIFSRVSSDDVVKPGSDCALGFTRPAHNYMVRNIVGNTNCNLIQIGSETADDIQQVYVDNIYVLGANKAGFSISTNDGAFVKDVYLNSGKTGPLRERSKMYRSTTPFFISISNRGRIIGAEAGRYQFTDEGRKHDELLIKNVNIGHVENINLKDVDVYEVYGGSSYASKNFVFKPYDGSQRKATPIIAGYKLPNSSEVTGGLDFKLPDGRHTGYVKDISFDDVHVLVKGGNPVTDTLNAPAELGVGQYNVNDLKIQPSYGIWARHVEGLKVTNSSFNYEQRDSRYAIFLDDVHGGTFLNDEVVRPADNAAVVKIKNATDVKLQHLTFFDDVWGKSPQILPEVKGSTVNSSASYPDKK